MPALTEQITNLGRRVDALESTEISESESLPLISKIYVTVNCTPITCSESLACDTTVECDDDVAGVLAMLYEQLTHIGIGTGAAPAPGDPLLDTETARKLIADSMIVDDTLLCGAYWDESEANGVTYTNTGIFIEGTDTVDTGALYAGDDISKEKDSTNTLTIEFEITAVEV